VPLDARWSAARRLLLARLDNAGDVVMLGPALRAIRAGLPSAHLTLWASPAGAEAAGLLPEIDDVFVTRALWQDLGHLPFDPERERDVIQSLADRAFDALIVFTSFAQSPLPPAYAAYLAGVPLRAGSAREFGGSVLSDVVAPPADRAHQVERSLHLVRELGFSVASDHLAVTISDEARDSLGLKLRLHGIGLGRPFILLHPGASCAARRYPADRFGEVGQLLYRALGWPIVISGHDRDRRLAATVASELEAAAVPLAGETSLAELSALIDRATVLVTNNTATMHLADALGTPEVVLFSGTERTEQWEPRSTPHRLLRRATPCSPCYRFECPFALPCLDVPPRDVVSAVVDLVGAIAE
jgi:ADP-heptose:LPS heptosyltransferase